MVLKPPWTSSPKKMSIFQGFPLIITWVRDILSWWAMLVMAPHGRQRPAGTASMDRVRRPRGRDGPGLVLVSSLSKRTATVSRGQSWLLQWHQDHPEQRHQEAETRASHQVTVDSVESATSPRIPLLDCHDHSLEIPSIFHDHLLDKIYGDNFRDQSIAVVIHL